MTDNAFGVWEGEVTVELPDAFDAGLYFIGRVRTPWTRREQCPKNARESEAVCVLEVEERFAPARVLEFYASTQAAVVLANSGGRKPGALGRPLRGCAPLRVARYDADRGRLTEGTDGCAVDCATDESGMLLARVEAPRDGSRTLRSVFTAGDTWLATGDLASRDADGDFWLQGPASQLIHTGAGPVSPRPIQDALDNIPEVSLAVAYGLPLPGAERERDLLAAAVSVRPGTVPKATALTKALAALEPSQRPAVVRVVEDIPVTSAFRPTSAQLRRRS